MVEARKASLRRERVGELVARPRRPRAPRRSARRVIESRMPVSSAGVRSSPSVTQKIVEVGASSTTPSGRTSRASSAPRGLGDPGRVHVGAVGERLDPGEDHGRRVGDRGERDGVGMLDQRLGQGDRRPPRVTRRRSWASASPFRSSRAAISRLELGPLRPAARSSQPSARGGRGARRARTDGPRRGGSPRRRRRRGRARRRAAGSSSRRSARSRRRRRRALGREALPEAIPPAAKLGSRGVLDHGRHALADADASEAMP